MGDGRKQRYTDTIDGAARYLVYNLFIAGHRKRRDFYETLMRRWRP